MVKASKVVEILNDAVRRDWQAMQRLIEARHGCNEQLAQHETIIVVPIVDNPSVDFAVGSLGLVNGLLDKGEPLIEAMFDAGELISFRVRGDDSPPHDQRIISISNMVVGLRYRTTDRANNHWDGIYQGPGQPHEEQGVYLTLSDGAKALIYFHDVAKVICTQGVG